MDELGKSSLSTSLIEWIMEEGMSIPISFVKSGDALIKLG